MTRRDGPEPGAAHCPMQRAARVVHSQSEVLPRVEGGLAWGCQGAVCPCRMRPPPPHSYSVWLQENKFHWSHFRPQILQPAAPALQSPFVSSCGVATTSTLPAGAPGDAAGEEIVGDRREEQSQAPSAESSRVRPGDGTQQSNSCNSSVGHEVSGNKVSAFSKVIAFEPAPSAHLLYKQTNKQKPPGTDTDRNQLALGLCLSPRNKMHEYLEPVRCV